MSDESIVIGETVYFPVRCREDVVALIHRKIFDCNPNRILNARNVAERHRPTRYPALLSIERNYSDYGDGIDDECLYEEDVRELRDSLSKLIEPNYEHLARDLVALLFWRWRKAKVEKKWATEQVGEFTKNAFEAYELEAQCAFLDARAHLLNKTKGDE